jgi:hypothetical protein
MNITPNFSSLAFRYPNSDKSLIHYDFIFYSFDVFVNFCLSLNHISLNDQTNFSTCQSDQMIFAPKSRNYRLLYRVYYNGT